MDNSSTGQNVQRFTIGYKIEDIKGQNMDESPMHR
jgi:hypothetical protein